jgi:hypothetical protein
MKTIAGGVTARVLVIGLVSICSLTAAGGAATAASYTLRGSYIDAGYYGASGLFSPRNTNTAIGKPIIVNCPGPSGSCVVEADLFIQSGKSDVTGNQYNLCLFVDGASAPNCQLVGSTPSDFTYTNGSTSQQATVTTSYKRTFSHTRVRAFSTTPQTTACIEHRRSGHIVRGAGAPARP